MGALYVVATPIGNLEDITIRALAVLKQVSLIAAEDTRRTRKLLMRYGIDTPMTSYYEHNKLVKLDYLLEMLREKDVALVSEAGTPGISDPGYELIRAAIAASVPVVPIPGPSAVIAALAVSGLPTDQFTFVGFLPRRRAERRARLRSLATENRTMIAYEAPHRLIETLGDIVEVLGNRQLCVARELTKVHEEVLRGSAEEIRHHFTTVRPQGEFTLVIAGAPAERPSASEEAILAQLEALLDAGLSGKDAVEKVADQTGHPKKHVYRLLLRLKREP